MAFTTPRDWVAGEVVTAALMNTHVRDNLRYIKGLDGAIALSDNIDFIGAQTVDGLDVSGHGSATAYAGHGNDIGGHTHQSAGAQGGQLDHGLALTGLADDDHPAYPPKTMLTTQGDFYQRGTATVERFALGAAETFLKSDGTTALWAAGVTTFTEIMGTSFASMGTGWSNWDMSDIVPSGAAAVNVQIIHAAGALKVIGLRKNGATIERKIGLESAERTMFMAECDGDRITEVFIESAGMSPSFTCMGYWT